jgi:hypothetical protein
MNAGVEIVLKRMETHPEEFYYGVEKWSFIYKEYYRDALTETEKGMIFDKIKQVRLNELTGKVMTTLTDEKGDDEFENKSEVSTGTYRMGNKPQIKAQGTCAPSSLFGMAEVKAQGQKVGYK